MFYVIVNETTGLLEKSLDARKHHFETEQAAKTSLRAKEARRSISAASEADWVKYTANRKPRTPDVWTVMSLEEYKSRFPQTKMVKSLRNPDGPEIEIDINTPAGCDPSTETHWSM